MNRRRLLLLGALAVAAPVACASPDPGGQDVPEPAETPSTSGSAGTSATPGPAPATAATPLADPRRRRVAEAVVSSFENSSTTSPYDVAERLGDGRGITAGRAGFTSGTHDLLLVVRRYERSAGGDNPLARYAPALEAVDRRVRDGGDGGDTEGLDGFEAAWRRASDDDPRLDRAQDAVYDELYFAPAMAQAARTGVRTPLGGLVLLDSAVQHGTDDDPDGLPAMVAETTSDRGAPAADEPGWLRAFLRVRRGHLLAPRDPETAEVWRASTPRIDTLLALLDQGRLDLDPPLAWTFAGDRFRVDG